MNSSNTFDNSNNSNNSNNFIYFSSDDELYTPIITPEPYFFDSSFNFSMDPCYNLIISDALEYNNQIQYYNDSLVYDQVLHDSLDDENPYYHVLSEEGKKQLSYLKYSNTFEEKICPITQEEFEENEEIIKLPCNHYFSKLAIEKWLFEENASCPICKYALKSIEIKKNIIQEYQYESPIMEIINGFEDLSDENITEDFIMGLIDDYYIESINVSPFSSSSSSSDDG